MIRYDIIQNDRMIKVCSKLVMVYCINNEILDLNSFIQQVLDDIS